MCPIRPRKPCSFSGCPELTDEKYCDKHKMFNSSDRRSAASRGYDSKWRTARNRFLKANPLCVYCLKDNKLVTATVVDHITPHRGDKVLFWDENNWQPLCKKCHDKKTRTKDRYQEYKY